MKELAQEVAKASPPVGVSTLMLFGISLSDWTLILTAAYTLLLIAVLVRDKVVKPWLAGRKQPN
jgi:disulfide bond formation protein DsbB